MKILLFKIHNAKHEQVKHCVGKHGVLYPFDDESEILNLISDAQEECVLMFPTKEQEVVSSWKKKLESRFSHMHFIEMDKGDDWENSLSRIVSQGGGLSLNLDLTEELNVEDALDLSENDDLSLGDDDLSLGNDDLSLGNDDLSLGNDDLSLGNDDLSLGNDDLSLGGDDLSLGGDDLSLGGDDLSLAGDDLSLGDDDLSLGDEEDLLSQGEPTTGITESLDLNFEEEVDSFDESVNLDHESTEKIEPLFESEVERREHEPTEKLDFPSLTESMAEDSLAKEPESIRDIAIQNDVISPRPLSEYSETIQNLREDRERLLEKIESLEIEKENYKKKILGLEALFDEKKIEISLSKKRFTEDYTKLRAKVLELEKREKLAKSKNENLESELEQMNKKTYLDLKKIQMREKKLDSQLNLLRTDTDTQIKNRDTIILDLKRKIDLLEFDIEQSWKTEKAAKKEKILLQNKIDRLLSSLKDVVDSVDEQGLDSWLDESEFENES